ncbi:MAG: substrate-binding domain-containing protein [Clostridia bacterium]|nr:substrate-binding domain-containing protein [Clostridia bacterium]
MASNFLNVPEEELDFKYTTGRSSEVYSNLIDGKVDVIFAAEISEGDKKYAEEKGVELEITPATSSAFVFVVNKENKVDNLTLEQIQKIYTGEITNWKEVGGDDEEIIAYQRPQGSGSQTAMLNLVMKDKQIAEPKTKELELEMAGLINAVAEYDNAKNAIGYSYFYYVNTMYKNENVKMIKVNGVEPTIKTIKDGSYPIYTNGFIVTRKDPDENTKKWVENVLGKRGSKIIEDAGYVPMN